MVEIDEGIDYSSSKPKNVAAQFSLRALLLIVLAVAVCLAFFRGDPFATILSIGGLLAIAVVGWQRHFWRRFALAFAIMVGANLIPTYHTWQAFQLDGAEHTGWPFTFFKRGYVTSVAPHCFLADLVIAVAVAYFAAKLLKDGWRTLFHQIQTWGFEDTA